MDNSNIIIPPHLNAEIYRSDTTTNTSPYLDFIKFHTDGSVLIGCSELTGRYWDGSAHVFKSIEDAKTLHKDAKKTIELNTGTGDGCFVENSSKVLLCEDSGALSIWSISNDAWSMWSQDMCVNEHDDGILAMDCLVPGSDYITVGADGNAKIWDINEMICMRHYDDAHAKAIYGVATKPGSTTTFVTGSADHYVSLWSDLVTKPVLDLVRNNHGVRCVQWLDENRVVFGDESGKLAVIDIRNTETVTTLHNFPAAVHKIVPNAERDKLAICCDNKIVTVCAIDDDHAKSVYHEDRAKVMYHDQHSHNHYVRGLAWDLEDMNTLHSVGWDGEIRTHFLSNYELQL